ncbi:hypothetical protein ACP4OV_028692 [Aristida adscensionis]
MAAPLAVAVLLASAALVTTSAAGAAGAGGNNRMSFHAQARARASFAAAGRYGDPTAAAAEHHPSADGLGVAREFLAAHNRVRAAYGVPALRWSSRLARYARRWSAARRLDCALAHSPASPFGENVFRGSGGEWRAADAVGSWAGEAAAYDWRAQACQPGKVCGHFTQLVWNDTEIVGCGRAVCLAGAGVIVTCSYDPPGNWKGEVPLT